MEKADVEAWMQEHYPRNPIIQEMARVFGYSETNFGKAFRRLFGTTPKQYILHMRLQEAYRLLRQGYCPSDVCVQLRFSSRSTFTKLFKRQFGILPKMCQKRRHFER